MYFVRKFLKKFNLDYDLIDACVQDFCLLTNNNKNAQACPKCNNSRWKVDPHTNKILKGQPAK